MKIDYFARLSVLCPNRMTTLLSNINPDVGYRRNVAIYVYPLVSGHIGEIRDILALC